MLRGSTWELSQAELREYQLCHGIDTILGGLYYFDPQTTQSLCGNLAAMSIPSLLLNTPSHQTFATFLPPHQQQYLAKGPIKSPAQMALLLLLSASVATFCQGGHFPAALFTCLNVGVR